MVNPAPPIQAAAMQQPAQFDDWQSDTVMQEEILNSLNHLAHSVRAIAREMTRAPRPPFYKRHYKPLVAAIALGTLVYCYPTATQNLISNVQNISAQALNQTLAAMPQGVKDFGSTVFNQTVAITPQPIQDFTVNLATSVKDTTVATAQTALDLWDIAGRIHQLVRLGKDVLVTANRVAEGIAFAAGIPAAMLNGAVNGIIYNINPLESLTTGKIIGMGGINIISYEALDIFVKYSKRLPVIRRIVNNIPVAEISAPLFKISLAVYKCFNRIPVIGRVMRILPLSDRDRHGDRPLEMTAPLFKIAAAVYITANTALDPSFGLSDLFDHQTYKKMYNYAVTSVKDRVNYVITSAGNVYNYVTSPATVNAASQKASDTWVTITSAQTYTDLYDYLRSDQAQKDAITAMLNGGDYAVQSAKQGLMGAYEVVTSPRAVTSYALTAATLLGRSAIARIMRRPNIPVVPHPPDPLEMAIDGIAVAVNAAQASAEASAQAAQAAQAAANQVAALAAFMMGANAMNGGAGAGDGMVVVYQPQ